MICHFIGKLVVRAELQLCQCFGIDLNKIFVFIVLVSLKDSQDHNMRLKLCKYPKTGKISVPPLSGCGVTE